MERERERARQRDSYDNVLAIDKAARQRSEEGQVVVRGQDLAWQPTRHARLKAYLVPSRVSNEPPATVVDDWLVSVQEIATRSGRHRHEGGVLIYVAAGRGYSIVAGQRLDWEPGDVLVLPLLAEGVEHQHFNADPAIPARLVTFSNILLRDWLAGGLATLADAPDARAGMRRRDVHTCLEAYADAASRRASKGRVVVRGEDTPWRQNRQALVRRYLWSSRGYDVPTDTALDDWRVFAQHIRIHSGKHRHQGGLVIYCLAGEGYTELEGERLEWQAGDLLLLPFHGHGGYEHQHFNKDDDNPARWIAFNNSTTRIWTGSQMTQITQHPDFRED